jgi:hypothetical protein
MALDLSSLPSLPDASSLPLPSVSDVTDAVSDVFVTAIDTAGDAATVVVETARRRPKVAIGVGVAAVVLVVVVWLRRRRHAAVEQVARDERKPRVVAA